jgi:ubiquinone/menaquinone biosynthesis C-methylase UbiE
MSQKSQIVNKGSRLPLSKKWKMVTPVHAHRVFMGEISLKGAKSMHEFLARHLHPTPGKESGRKTKGLTLNSGWRYDLGEWFADTFLFAGKLGKLRQRTVTLARLRPGETVLDVGCGTGTLAIEAQKRVGTTGHVFGIDPGEEQIARAHTKAARRHVPIDFQVGVIEHLPFADQTFDAVFSSLMMHHLPAPLKRQGVAEIARVLKAGGRLVIADFTHKADRAGRATSFHAGGSRVHDLVALLKEAGFERLGTEEVPPARSSSFPGVGFICAFKSAEEESR